VRDTPLAKETAPGGPALGLSSLVGTASGLNLPPPFNAESLAWFKKRSPAIQGGVTGLPRLGDAGRGNCQALAAEIQLLVVELYPKECPDEGDQPGLVHSIGGNAQEWAVANITDSRG
jgi:hypothetical protein